MPATSADMPRVHHVMTSLSGGWAVRANGRIRARRRFASESEAIDYARGLGRGVIYLHRPDGTVREKVTI